MSTTFQFQAETFNIEPPQLSPVELMTKNEQEVLYAQYCRENGVKPLEQILVQLQQKKQQIELKNLSKFEFGPASLVLARNNGLITLIMDQVQFDGEQLIYLLANAKYLKRLVIKNCDMGYRSSVTEGIFTALPRSLIQLHIISSKMADNSLRALVQAIRDGKICDVNLDGNSFKDVRGLLDALVSKNAISLSVSQCGLPAAQRQYFSQFLINGGTKVRYLNCSGNKFQTDGLQLDRRPQEHLADSAQKPEPLPVQPPKPQAAPLQRQASFLKVPGQKNQQNNLLLTQQPSQMHQKQALLSPKTTQERDSYASTFPEYTFLDIQEECNDFAENMQSLKNASQHDIDSCVEVAQQIIISTINKLQEFQTRTIDTFKQNFLGYQQLQRFVQERQNQITQLYEQKIYRQQQENIEKAKRLQECLNTFNETYIKDGNFDLHDNQVELYSLKHEIAELEAHVKQLETQKKSILDAVEAKKVEINNISPQYNEIFAIMNQNGNENSMNRSGNSWKDEMKRQIRSSIKTLYRKIEDRKACLAELMEIYQESKQLGLQ